MRYPDFLIHCERCERHIVKYKWVSSRGTWEPNDRHAVTEEYFNGIERGWFGPNGLFSEDGNTGTYRVRDVIKCKCGNSFRADKRKLFLAFMLARHDGDTRVTLTQLREHYRKFKHLST